MESGTEDKYIKPGNQQRGWNDPPQFSYGLQMSRGPQRNLLNRRPPLPPGVGAPPMMPPSLIPPTPPRSDTAPPPACPAHPPPGHVATPPPPPGPIGCQGDAVDSQSECEVSMEGAVSALNRALSACRRSVSAQVCNDVAKRLRLLEDSWRAGQLSLPVQKRMKSLALEFQCGRWDSADEIHRSLMVDHVTEVSQWMVGVKRLIAETRNLHPEVLEPLWTSKEQTPGPDPDHTPVDPDHTPVDPDHTPVDPDHTPDSLSGFSSV